MNTELSIAIAGILLTILGLAVGWGKYVNTVDQFKDKFKEQEDQNENFWKQIQMLRTSNENHAKESAQVRLELEGKISNIRENAVKVEAKLDIILTTINRIEQTIREAGIKPKRVSE